MDKTSFLLPCVSHLRSHFRKPSSRRSNAGSRKAIDLSGMVDHLESRVLLTAEFGDAPAPYPVTLAENGARHTGTGPKLGLTVDVEADGVHSASAVADGADEDGIVFGSVFAGQSDASVVVKVRNAAHGTKLDAWIDFNADGDWDDAGEKIFDSVQVFNNTDQTLTFAVPADAVLGTTFSRFRISSAGGLSPTGEAPDGEVEDHKLTIAMATPVIIAPALLSKVSVTGDYRVTFEWTEAAQAQNYEIWVRSHNYQAQSEFLRTTVSGTSYTPDLDFGIGKYTVWMRSLWPNNIKSAWTAPRPFFVVAKTTITPMTKMQPTARPEITWSPVTGAESYKIWISNLSTQQSPVILQGGLTTTSFTPPSSLPIGVYRVWVSAISANTTEGWSLPVDFQVAPAPVTTQITPTFLAETYSWTPIVGAAAYEFQLRNMGNGETVLSQTLTGTGTSWTPGTVLFSGVQYRWWVRAKSAQGVYSLWSAPSDFIAGGQTTVLSPTGTSANRMPTFTWTTVTGAARYELLVTRLDGTPGINNKRVLTNSYTPTTNLAVGTYRIWVRAVSTSGVMSTWSRAVTVTIVSSDAPYAPTTDREADRPVVLASIHESPLARETVRIRELSPQRSESTVMNERPAEELPKATEVAEVALPDSLQMDEPVLELIDMTIAAWVNRPVDLA